MPLISTFGSAGSQSFGTRGIQLGGSALFNGSGDALTTSPNNAFIYGTGNFTVEMWVYPLDFSDYRFLWQQTSTTRDTRFWIYSNIATGQLVYVNGPNATAITSNGLTLNDWNHVALVRNSLTTRFFLNGVGYAPATDVRNYNFDNSGACIGKVSSVSNLYPWSGYITNVRVAKQAIYTSNFTPTGPLSRNSQSSSTTQLLLNMRSSSTLTTDSSANSITVNNLGSVTYSPLTPFNRPYVIPPTVIVSSAVVTPSTTTPNEGNTITVNIVGTNTPDGTYYYSLQEELGTGALTGADFTSGSLTGSFNINGNAGSFPITVTRDLLTEGNETFTIYIRTGSTNGPIIGTSAEITITDSSLTPAFTVAPTTFEEPQSSSYTVQNIGPDGTYFWTILHGTTSPSDFLASSGSFLVGGSTGGLDNGVGSFGITVLQDRVTEGSETFQVQVRSGSTSGPVILTSNVVTITDTSLTPAFTATPASISEGSSGSFTVNNLGPAGTYYWTILNGTTTNADFTATSGSFTTSTLNGSGTFTVTPAFDYTSDASETFQVQVREGSISGAVIVTSSSVLIGDTSTTVTATPSPTTITEGTSTTISVSATALPTGTYYWTILNGTTTNADFTATSGSFSVFLNSGSFTVTAATLDGAEGAETFQVQIRTDSTSGAVIATTSTITISASVN